MTTRKIKGLSFNSRSPGSISNAEHHDLTGSHKGVEGTPVTIKTIVPVSTVSTPVGNQAIIRVANTTGATAFVWIGEEGSEPATVNISNGIAIPPNTSEVLYSGISDDDQKALMVKASAATLQVVIMEG